MNHKYTAALNKVEINNTTNNNLMDKFDIETFQKLCDKFLPPSTSSLVKVQS